MVYQEIKKDLFTIEEKYALGHCVAQDGAMGAGIALVFCKLFGSELRTLVREYNSQVSDVVYYYSEKKNRGIYNIITKERSSGKPTRKTFDDAIMILKDKMVERGDKHLAIPMIGAGLDRLSWHENSRTIQRIFAETDIEIVVCKL